MVSAIADRLVRVARARLRLITVLSHITCPVSLKSQSEAMCFGSEAMTFSRSPKKVLRMCGTFALLSEVTLRFAAASAFKDGHL